MDIYRIAVRIALTNGMSPVLAIISRDLVGVHARVGEIEKSFGRWALAIGGMGAIMAGGTIFGGMAKLAERGAEVNHQLELMKLQGMQIAEIHEAAARAMQVSGSVLTSTYAENLRHIRELRYAFGSTPVALQFLEAVTKANATLNAMKGGGVDQVWELVKSLEQKGLTAKPDEFLSYINQMTKAVVASGGKVTPAQFFSAFQYGRTAMLGWDETFITQYLPRLIQSMSGAGGGGGFGQRGPGNALMSAFAKVVQGQMPKAAALMWRQLGLATISHIRGSAQSLTNVRGKYAFEKNPYEWVQSILVPALKAHGIVTQDKIIDVISRMFPVRTASQIITEMTLQGRAVLGDLSPFEKDARLQRAAFDQRMSYDELIKNDYQTMMTGFHAQWKSFAETVGAPLTEPGGPIVAILADITTLLHSVTAVAQAHPEAIRIVADALAALATSLIVAGLVALGAAIAPLVGAGGVLVALATGLAALAALNWSAIQKASESIAHWIEPITKPVEDWMHKHLPFLDYRYQSPVTPKIERQSYLFDLPDRSGNRSIGFNVVPPPSPEKTGVMARPPVNVSSSSSQQAAQKTIQVSTTINLDGRKIAEAVTKHQVEEGAGPPEGAPYHDSTYSTMPPDFALAL